MIVLLVVGWSFLYQLVMQYNLPQTCLHTKVMQTVLQLRLCCQMLTLQMSISAYVSFWLRINPAFGFWQLKGRNNFNLATTNVRNNEEKGYGAFWNYYEPFPYTSRHFQSPNPLPNFFWDRVSLCSSGWPGTHYVVQWALNIQSWAYVC